ncbi:uncharacterized protein SPSK_06633 [Sporothrix schenckii 1099-18]|uniref:Uncharacterized protein n=1 Tax=Sporothrix schenckii 1099-18 TaxID=1397361 RepID=A0A0F2MI85_SPOSC|nr:uncharacterized protein SPSK_06633 [Sporothrix schenckii 1099-18]KJR89342.1 hypothetical protein SPSK_06633 [Sporothrix schenckii 1099-18]
MGCFRTLFPFGKGDAAKTASSEAEQFTDSLAPGQSAQEPPADAQQAVEIVETHEAILTSGGHPEEQELAHRFWHLHHHLCLTKCCKCCSCCDNCCDSDGCCGCCNCNHHCGLGILCCLPFLACRAICRCCCCCFDPVTVQEATILETTTAVATAEPATEPATEPVIEQGIEPVIETVVEPVTGLLPAVSSASETEPLLTKSSVVRTITA